MSTASMKEDAIQVLEACLPRSKRQVIMGIMSARLLVAQFVVPYHDHRNKTGYQREPSQARVNRLVADLENKRVDLPTAVLLNLREFEEDTHLERSKGTVMFRVGSSELSVVDGQHRVLALKKLLEDNPEKWSDYPIAFVCMLGASEREEMEQFYVVNSTAKSVRTDLALSLLKQRAEADARVMDQLRERGETWKVGGQTLVEELAKSSLWKGRIRFPGDDRGATTIGNAGMANSLKPVLGTPYFGQISTANQIKILNAYWKGISRLLPDAFTAPDDFIVQKSTGVMIFHALLVSVIELIRSRGQSPIEEETYETVLRDALLNMEGDTTEGEIARGIDFWKSGPEGAAGSFSSNAGRRVLLAKLREQLPRIELE
jgi:DGQHR domain-containing protein